MAVSDWQLARAVAQRGHLGVVSGTALNSVLIRRLQDGDAEGNIRRALAHCPVPNVARIIELYWIAGGRAPSQPYRLAPLFTLTNPRELTALTVAANFVEVFLAKEGHDGLVGLNLLEKVQLPTLASLYGAMLAGVDYVLMGAGIPRAIPGALDRLAAGEKATLRVAVDDKPTAESVIEFDPASILSGSPPALRRPRFLAIVSSFTLALTLARKSNGQVNGFVVEDFSAGGHNAPPRGTLRLNGDGEPIYGPRDIPDLIAIRALGLPFWLAGSNACPERLRAALACGAAGVQIGTAFAFCRESGMRADIKREVLQRARTSRLELRTDPRASPTGMPFKVLQLPGTVAATAVYASRVRQCDLGYLRQPYCREDGSVGYRCPAENPADYLRKGGLLADTVDRKCLCNGLLAAIGQGQARKDGTVEPAIVTAGEDALHLTRYLAGDADSYGVDDVLRALEV